MDTSNTLTYKCQQCEKPFLERTFQNHFCSSECAKESNRNKNVLYKLYRNILVIDIKTYRAENYIIVYQRLNGKRVAHLLNTKDVQNVVYQDEKGTYVVPEYDIKKAVRVRLYRLYPKYVWVTETGLLISRKTLYIVTLTPNAKGYLRKSIYRTKHIKPAHKIRAHRAVAEMFVPKVEGKDDVNHIDGDKQNNHYTNLEWVTPGENNIHAIRLGLKKYRKPKTEEMSVPEVVQ